MSAFQQCKERGNSFFQRQQYDQVREVASARPSEPTLRRVVGWT